VLLSSLSFLPCCPVANTAACRCHQRTAAIDITIASEVADVVTHNAIALAAIAATISVASIVVAAIVVAAAAVATALLTPFPSMLSSHWLSALPRPPPLLLPLSLPSPLHSLHLQRRSVSKFFHHFCCFA
jgi:hypothetical protein